MSSIRDQAADWVARRVRGLSAAEQASFADWCATSAAHRAAVREMEATWSAVSYPAQSGLADVARELLARRQQRRRRRHRAVGAVILAAAAALVIGFFWRTENPPPSAPAPTFVAKPDRQTFPDGSTAELNAGTDLAVAYTPERRTIRLLRGEALFEVKPDPSRPFVVTVAGVEVRAVGTAFSVRLDATRLDVLVTHGQVAVERASDRQSLLHSDSPAPVLAAGQRVSIPLGSPAPVPTVALPPVDLAAALTWRGKRIEFTGTSLAEAVELFNRQNRLQLSVADAPTSAIRISGIFWVDDPEGFVRLVEKGFSVQAQAVGNTLILRSR